MGERTTEKAKDGISPHITDECPYVCVCLFGFVIVVRYLWSFLVVVRCLWSFCE